MKINNFNQPIVSSSSSDSSQQTTPASQPSLAPDKDTIETPTSTTQFQQAVADASAQSVQFSDDEGEVFVPSLTPAQQQNAQQIGVIRQLQLMGVENPTQEQIDAGVKLANDPAAQKLFQQQIGVARQLQLMGVENPSQEQIDAGVKLANDPAAQNLLQQQIGVARQLQLMGVENPTQEQIDAGVKIANDPAAQKLAQQQIGVARQLTLMGVENITQEQIDAGVKILNDPAAQQQLQQQIGNARDQILQGKTPDGGSTLGSLLLDSVLNPPGNTPSGAGSSILNSVLNTQGNTPWTNALDGVVNTPGTTPWNLFNSMTNANLGSTSGTTQSGTQGTGGISDPKSGGDTGTTAGLFSTHGFDSGASGTQTDPVTPPGSDQPASDPSDWLPFPGSSSGDSGSSAAGIGGVDVRDDGSVQIVLSDGTTQEFSNFDDAANWEKQQGMGPAQSNSSDGGITAPEDGTVTSSEGSTTVTVEAPAQDDSQPSQTDDSNDSTDTNESTNTSENIDPDGYYDMGGGSITDTGALDMKLAGGGVTDGINPDLQTEDEPPILNLPPREDGGVSDYIVNPRLAGVIDTTEEGSEGAATGIGSLPDPNNVAQPETRPELEPDAPDAPNQPGVDPFANKG